MGTTKNKATTTPEETTTAAAGEPIVINTTPVPDTTGAVADTTNDDLIAELRAQLADANKVNEELQAKLETAELTAETGKKVVEHKGKIYKINCKKAVVNTPEGSETLTADEIANNKGLIGWLIEKGSHLIELIEEKI